MIVAQIASKFQNIYNVNHMLKIHNTLSGKKEEFKSISDKQVSMYSCGPTVYDYAHIGNLRAYIFADILKRTLEYNNYEVRHVMNITDIGHLVSDSDEGEDKMTKALRREGKPLTLEAMKAVADFYADRFKENLTELNIKTPTVMPKASEHIAEDIEIIKILEEKDCAYRINDGIYFDISKFKEYGKLGNIKLDANNEQARIQANPEKRNSRDFCLWKFNSELGWESPWGKGFPGWHIECSAMSTKYLGQPFDIHTGGIDHIPVHHQNEIAQSEMAYNKPLANYWTHCEFLNIGEQKMAKSAGNFTTLATLKEKGINPLAYRFFALGAHYRTPMNFSWEALSGSQNGLEHLYNQIRAINMSAVIHAGHLLVAGEKKVYDKKGMINTEYKNKFLEAINDDLNTPQALAIVQELLKSDLPAEYKLATVLDFDEVLGLNLKQVFLKTEQELPQNILELAEKRKKAKATKNFSESDDLRKQIEAKGYKVEDRVDEEQIIIKIH